MTDLFIEYWPWILGYFGIGLISMCIIQYIKGRGSNGGRSVNITRNMELDMLSSAAIPFWPIAIVFVFGIVILMALVYPFIKLSNFFESLGQKHCKVK